MRHPQKWFIIKMTLSIPFETIRVLQLKCVELTMRNAGELTAGLLARNK